jgi:mono/diheme cytochrome c family protein
MPLQRTTDGGKMGKILGLVCGIGLLAVANPGVGQELTGNAERGGKLAERWCSTCHIVSDTQARATTEAPTFQSIAERSPEAIDALGAFLMDPHPPMPDLSLTRQEIRDLLSYIESLR